MPPAAVVEVRARRTGAKCGDAARESAGVAVPVLAGQHAAAQRRPGQHAEPERRRGRQHLALDAALQQRVLDLGRRPAAPGRATACCQVTARAGLPAGVVRDADVPRPAGRDRVVQRRQRLLQRTSSRPGVHLPQVDVVGAQPAAASRPGRRSSAPREVSTTRSPVRRGDAGLGREHQLVAVDHVAEQRADQPLGLAVAVRRRPCRAACRRPPRTRRAGRAPRARRCRGPRSWCRGRAGTPPARLRPSVRCSMGGTYRRTARSAPTARRSAADRLVARVASHATRTEPRLLGRRQRPRTTSRWPRRPTGSATRSAWAAEAYGSDAATVLAWIAAQTERDRRRRRRSCRSRPGPRR